MFQPLIDYLGPIGYVFTFCGVIWAFVTWAEFVLELASAYRWWFIGALPLTSLPVVAAAGTAANVGSVLGEPSALDRAVGAGMVFSVLVVVGSVLLVVILVVCALIKWLWTTARRTFGGTTAATDVVS